MKVLVCGGRDYDAVHIVYKTLDQLNPSIVVHGAARGADSLAGAWAKERGVEVRPYPADWKNQGKMAGPLRNRLMLDTEMPDLVVAFPGGRGTAHMVKIAKAAGYKILEVG